MVLGHCTGLGTDRNCRCWHLVRKSVGLKKKITLYKHWLVQVSVKLGQTVNHCSQSAKAGSYISALEKSSQCLSSKRRLGQRSGVRASWCLPCCVCGSCGYLSHALPDSPSIFLRAMFTMKPGRVWAEADILGLAIQHMPALPRLGQVKDSYLLQYSIILVLP